MVTAMTRDNLSHLKKERKNQQQSNCMCVRPTFLSVFDASETKASSLGCRKASLVSLLLLVSESFTEQNYCNFFP